MNNNNNNNKLTWNNLYICTMVKLFYVQCIWFSENWHPSCPAQLQSTASQHVSCCCFLASSVSLSLCFCWGQSFFQANCFCPSRWNLIANFFFFFLQKLWKSMPAPSGIKWKLLHLSGIIHLELSLSKTITTAAPQ